MSFQKIELLMNIEILSEKDRIILNFLREKKVFNSDDFKDASDYLKEYIIDSVKIGNGGYIWI
jgi:hypothetical protein